MRIVSTDATISAEPDDTFAIREDCIDVIGAQTARSAVKGETLYFCLRDSKYAASVRAYPHFVGDGLQRHDWTARSFETLEARRFVAGKSSRFLFFRARAGPELAVPIVRQRVNEEGRRLHRDFLRDAVGDFHDTAAECADKNSIVHGSNAGDC